MSRRGKKLNKTEKRTRKDSEALDALVEDTAAVFRCAAETVEDCATECGRHCDDTKAECEFFVAQRQAGGAPALQRHA